MGISLGKQGFVNGALDPERCVFGYDPITHSPCRSKAFGMVIFNQRAIPLGLPIQVPQPMCEKHFNWTLSANEKLMRDNPRWQLRFTKDPMGPGGIIYNYVRYKE